MRSPTWISPPFGGQTLREDVIGGNEGDISSEQYTSGNEKDAFESGAQNHLEFRQKIGAEIILLFPFYTKGTDLQKAMHKVVLDEMLGRLGPGHEKVSTTCC